VTYRTRVADLAQATVLLGTRYHDWGPTSEVVRDAFVTAYAGEAALTGTEQNELRRSIAGVLKHFGWA
jgi:homoserine kinase type II